jgi:predicted nucleic acid-binding protein
MRGSQIDKNGSRSNVRLVVDASVAAKWFNIEELSDKAAEVKEAHVSGNLDLVAPTHIIYEVGNSIWNNTQLTDKDACDAIISLLRLGIELFPPSVERAGRAMKTARLRRTTFYDAVYLQIAEELNIALLTADEHQAAAGKGIIKVIQLREAKL